MSVYRTTLCRSCDAPIVWAVTRTGSRMPVDAEAHPDGTVELANRGKAAPLATVLKGPDREGRADLRRSHFSSCPNAAEWRNRKVGAS